MLSRMPSISTSLRTTGLSFLAADSQFAVFSMGIMSDPLPQPFTISMVAQFGQRDAEVYRLLGFITMSSFRAECTLSYGIEGAKFALFVEQFSPLYAELCCLRMGLPTPQKPRSFATTPGIRQTEAFFAGSELPQLPTVEASRQSKFS
jgi:hypothetical protein